MRNSKLRLPNTILGVARNSRAIEPVFLANVFLAKRQNGVVESPKRGPQSNCQQTQPQLPRGLAPYSFRTVR